MKIIEVEYMPNGNYIENYDKPYVIDDESGVCVRATFPQGESGSVRAYIGGSGTGDVVDCGTVSVLARTAQVILTDDNLAQGLIIVGFEVNTGAAAIRYRPLKLKVNQFVDPTGSNPHGYTVTVSVGTVTSLPAGSAPTVENVGTGKDVVLNFGIPKGDKGDSADVVDNLTSTDTDKALSANQGKVLDGKKVDKADGKGLSSNDYTTAEKTKVANLPDDTNTELSKKADKANSSGGFAGGTSSIAQSGGAIGLNAKANYGGAVGGHAEASVGGAVGYSAKVTNGGSIGGGAQTSDGFAGGYKEKTVNASGSAIDAIQLGMGTNCATRTLQVYNYQLMDANGYVPNERLRKISTGAVTSLLLKDRLEKQMLSSDTASLTLTIPAIPNSYDCAFSFKSGATATTLVYAATPITWRGTDCDADGDFTPRANAGYEVSIKCLGMDADNNPVVVARVGGF